MSLSEKEKEVLTEQIISIRDTGKTNMFATNTVQGIANDMGYYELVVFIEEDKKSYANFIMTGEFE